MALDLERWRSEFPVITEEGRHHLDNSLVSPIPQRAIDARREFETVCIQEPHPWWEWRDKIAEAKGRFADVINADPDEIAVLTSVTQSMAQITSAIDYEDDDEVVTTEMEFPTLLQFWDAQRRQRDVTVRLANSANQEFVTADEFDAVINDDTRLVSTSHAFSATGGLMDPKAVADLAHDRDGYFLLDAYQSLGVVPIDVEKQDIDILVTGVLKFLFGSPGIAFMYVDSDILHEFEPPSLGWFSAENRFETDDPDYAPDASRFQFGTPPIPNAYQSSAGLSIIQDVGPETIHERVMEHTEHLVEGARERGFTVSTPDDPTKRSSIVTIDVVDYEEAHEKIVEDGFNVSRLGEDVGYVQGIRVSPHFYTLSEEIEGVLDAIERHATPAKRPAKP